MKIGFDGELSFYENVGNWDFSTIKCEEVILEDEFDFFDWVKKYVKEDSTVLDLGTGGGEKLLEYFPKAKEIIGIDFSSEMIKTANENLKKSLRKNENIKFVNMDSNVLEFEDSKFDVVVARHTVINPKEIKRVLKESGILIIEGVAKDDSKELKEYVGRGQCYFDEIAIEKEEYELIKKENFKFLENKYMLIKEVYETREELYKLLFKAPIIDNINESDFGKIDKYINATSENGQPVLIRRIYGYLCQK